MSLDLHMRRHGAILMTVVALAAAFPLSAGLARDRASAAERLAYGGTSRWYLEVGDDPLRGLWPGRRRYLGYLPATLERHHLARAPHRTEEDQRALRPPGALGPPRRDTAKHLAHGPGPSLQTERARLLQRLRDRVDKRLHGLVTAPRPAVVTDLPRPVVPVRCDR